MCSTAEILANQTTIKIRFVWRKGHKNYAIQRRTWYGRWKYIGYTINMGYGSIYDYYVDETKEKLLYRVLECYYRKDKRFVNVHEYPTIKHY